MLNGVRDRLSYANVIATCALFVALGGGAYALEGRNTVDAGDLKKNAVKPPEVAKNAVRKAETAKNSVGTGEVIDGSLLGQDFAPGQLPAGEQGPPGERGLPGANATKLFGYVREPGGTAEAVLEYGSGITNVSDPASSTGAYTVTFNRSLDNCVVSALGGTGEPAGLGGIAASAPVARVDIEPAGAVELDWSNGNTDSATETSFMVAAFC
jgi:hypothetical protein